MSLAIIDGREWQSIRDLKTGEKRDDTGPIVKLLSKVLKENPFPGDMDPKCNQWVTDTALSLIKSYNPEFVYLTYSHQFYAFRFSGSAQEYRQKIIGEVFSEVQRFAQESSFSPVIIGTGGMLPAAEYIDLSKLEGTAVVSHWLTGYAGLYQVTERDRKYLNSLPGIRAIIDREGFYELFGDKTASIERLPDYLAVAWPGYCFRSTLLRKPRMVSEQAEFIAVSDNLKNVSNITDIYSNVLELLKTKKIALVILDGIGLNDFKTPARPCRNGKDWFNYEPCDGQHLTITTGKHQALNYPAGYKSYLEDGEDKGYPFSGYFTAIPKDTLGNAFEGRSIAVGNRSMFMHIMPGADISIECFARNLSNQGCLGVIHNQDK